MNVETKTAPVSDLGEHGFHVLLSDPSIDREGDQLHLHEWKTPLPQQIPFSADHDMTTNGVVGSGRPELTDRGLELHGRWAQTDRAQHVRQLVVGGHLKSVSVEFIRHSDKSGKVSRELIGGSFVHTPSNPAARVLSAKGVDIKAPSAPELLQAIHDASSLLGAQCVPSDQTEAAPSPDDGSDDGANKALAEALAVKGRLLRMRLS